MADEPEVQPQDPEGLSLLADDMYGKQEPPETEVDPEAPDPETPDPEASVEPDDPDEAPEEDEREVASIEELAEHLEADADWLTGLTITQKINGKEVQVSLSDALSTHRQVQSGESFLADAKEKAKGILEDANQQKDGLTTTIATFDKLLKSVEEDINRDVKDVDWGKLRKDDPAEYGAKREEIRERRERLERIKEEAKSSYQESIASHQQKMAEDLRARLQKERERLVEAMPDFGDEEKGQTLSKQISEHLLSRGFTEQEVNKAYDHRLVLLAHDAMQYQSAKGKSEAAKKKVVKIPKVTKPGSRKPKPNGGDDKKDPVSVLYG